MKPTRGVRVYPGQAPECTQIDWSKGLGLAIDPKGSVRWGEYIRLVGRDAVKGGLHLYCDEEALLKAPAPALCVVLPSGTCIHGPIVVSAGDDNGDERDLTPTEVDLVLAFLARCAE